MPNTNPNSVSPLRLTQHVLQEFCIEDLSLCVLSLTRASPHPACVLAGGLVSLLACVSFVRISSMPGLHPHLDGIPSSLPLCRTFIPISMPYLHPCLYDMPSPPLCKFFIPISILDLHHQFHTRPSSLYLSHTGFRCRISDACWTTTCMLDHHMHVGIPLGFGYMILDVLPLKACNFSLFFSHSKLWYGNLVVVANWDP